MINASEHINDHLHLPHPPMVNFVGRANLLTEIATRLYASIQGDTASSTNGAISGLRGIGKTQVTLQLSQQLRTSFLVSTGVMQALIND